MTATFHPSADDQAEKIDQIIEIGLRCILGDDTARYSYSTWIDYLAILEHEYNSLIHSSTDFTPN